jgi:hypothetical protein
MRSFDIVKIVNNVICQTGVDRILVCHDNTCMTAESGATINQLMAVFVG